MLTFKKFTGINNVLPSERLSNKDLAMASNVDVGMDNELRRRKGYASASAVRHANLWQADGFLLATRGDQGDLVNVDTDTTLYPSLGHERVWYTNLPDGRTTFSNGLINGVVSAAACTGWGVPLPATVGGASDVPGDLHPGDYQYSLAYVRDSDGLEGGPAYAAPVTIASGGIVLNALPALAGYSINVYLTSHFGGQGYLAGNTAGSMFSFTGRNDQLMQPCRTDFLHPAPVGTVSALWRGRVLVAVGRTLYASKHGQFELFDMQRDFKQFSADITLVMPMEGGIYVGTEKELVFLAGREFDKLAFNGAVDGSVVLGSGVLVDGEKILVGDKMGEGQAMMCIAKGLIVAGFDGGRVVLMTEGRYATDATEVWATVREVDGMTQYMASVL